MDFEFEGLVGGRVWWYLRFDFVFPIAGRFIQMPVVRKEVSKE